MDPHYRVYQPGWLQLWRWYPRSSSYRPSQPEAGSTSGPPPCLNLDSWKHKIHSIFCYNYHVDRPHLLTSDAPTNTGKHVTSNIACANSQWYSNDAVFRLAQMTVWCYKNSNLLLDHFKFSYRWIVNSSGQYSLTTVTRALSQNMTNNYTACNSGICW